MVPPRKTRSRACPRRTRVHADGAVRVRDGDQRHAAERLIGAGPVQRPLRVRGRAGRRDLRGKINGHLSIEKLSALVRVGPVPSALEACHAGWMHLEPSLKERRLRPRTARSRRRARAARGTPCERRGSGLLEKGEDARLFPTVALPFVNRGFSGAFPRSLVEKYRFATSASGSAFIIVQRATRDVGAGARARRHGLRRDPRETAPPPRAPPPRASPPALRPRRARVPPPRAPARVFERRRFEARPPACLEPRARRGCARGRLGRRARFPSCRAPRVHLA